MSRRRLDDLAHGRIIENIEKGRTMTSAAQEPGIAHSVVPRARRALRTSDTAARRRGGGRPRTTTLRAAVSPEFVFMDNNARPHRTAQVEELLTQEVIQRMEWLARSPGLNPIEHVQDAMGRGIAARPNAPLTVHQ
ncbi:hypothetical protein V3C99_016179, partial [Haemonchus contortus]